MPEPSTQPEPRPWDELRSLAEQGDGERLEAYVDAMPIADVAHALAHMDGAEQNQVLETLSSADAADLLEDLPEAQAADLLEGLSADVAAPIVHELPSDAQADVIAEIGGAEADAILRELDPEEARDILRLASYADDIAGGLMVTEFLAFARDKRVTDVLDDLHANVEAYADYEVQYFYVVDDAGRLVGVLRLRDLLLSPPGTVLSKIMIGDPLMVPDTTSLDELVDHFDRGSFLALPIVDAAGVLQGVVRRFDIESALTERAESDHLKSYGIVGGEELRTMPLLRRSSRRLSWLSINIVLNVAAASVIAVFEETLAAVIALAFFLPIISDMSGCSGNQAVAVSIRELTLGLVRPHELLWVWVREIGVGMINGAVLGALIGVVAFLWKGNAWLGLVVGVALAANTMIAVSIGGAVPLILKRFGMDPALASGPVLTTITDICGFFLVLGLATLLLAQLTG